MGKGSIFLLMGRERTHPATCNDSAGADSESSLPSWFSPDPHPPGSPGGGQAAVVTVRQPLDLPGLDEDKWCDDREGDTEGQPWGQVPPGLGQVFHPVRGRESAVGTGVTMPRGGAGAAVPGLFTNCPHAQVPGRIRQAQLDLLGSDGRERAHGR